MVETKPGAQRGRRADDPVPAEEVFLLGEHVHRPALAARIPRPAPGQLGHDPLGVHATGQHVRVVAICRDNRVAFFLHRIDAGDDCLLTYI